MIKKQITTIFIFALVILTLGYVSATGVTECTTLGSGTFELLNDLNCANDGIILNGNNLLLDCQGHTINYSSSGAEGDRGVEFWGTLSNITLKNCIIKMTNTTSTNLYRQGITLYDNSNSKVYNTTVEIWGAYTAVESWGASGATAGNNNFSHLTVISHESDGVGIGDFCENCILEHSVITVSDWAVLTWSGANNIKIKNNTITTTGGTYGTGVRLHGTLTGADISDNTISSVVNGIWMTNGATNSILTNNKLSSSTNAGIYADTNGHVLTGNNVTATSSHGLYLAGANINVTNSNVTVPGYGVYSSGANNNFSNSIFASTGNYGAYILNTNYISNSIITSSASYALYMSGASDGSRIINTNISRTNSGSTIDLLTGSDRLYFDNVKVTSISARGFYLAGTSNNLTIINSNITSVTAGVYVSTGGNGWNLTNNIVTSGGTGFDLIGVTNSSVNYNNITTSGSSALGISLSSTCNLNTFNDNIIKTTGSASHGFGMSGSDNNIINRLNVTTTGESSYGILVTTPDGSNLASGNVFANSTSLTGGSASGSNLACALYLWGEKNNFTNIDLKSTGGNGTIGYAVGAPALLIRNASNNYLKDMTLNAVSSADIMVRGEADYTSYFINVSYNEIAFNTAVAFQRQYLDFSWYVDVNVKNATTGLNLENVNVTIYNVSTIPIYSQLTDANGNINRQTVKAFLMNGTTTISHTPHNITANLSGYDLNSSVFNLTSVNNVNWLATLSASPLADTTPPYFTVIPENEAITYPTNWAGVYFEATDETGFGTFAVNDSRFTINSTGFLDDVSILGAGIYNLNITINDTSNNLNSTIYTLTVNQNSTYVLGISGTTPITYGTTTDVAGSGCPAELSCSLDKSNAIYGVDVSPVTFNYSTSGNTNYSANSITKEIVINQATPTGSIAGTSPIIYGTAGDVEGTESNTGDGDLTYKLYRNGVEVSNPDTTVLGVGVYNYVYNTTGGTNYSASASLDTFELTVNKATPTIELYIDGAHSNEEIDITDTSFIQGELDVGQLGSLNLTINGGQVNYTETLFNITYTFDPIGLGLYQVWLNYSGNANYTSATHNFNITVVHVGIPVVNILFPITVAKYNTPTLDLNYSVVEPIPDSCWYSKDAGATNSSAVTSGENFTGVTTSEGENTWRVYCNDSVGNIGFDDISFYVDTINPSVSGLTESPVDGSEYSPGKVYEFNATITDTNLDTVLIEFDGVNYSASNLAGDVYNFTIIGLAVGSYSYTWYANDTYGNSNNTETGTYDVIQNSTQTSLTFDKTSPQDYGNAITPTCSIIIGEGTPVLEMEGVVITSGDPITLGVGTYTFNCSLAESQNYTYSENVSDFTIDKAVPEGSLASTEGWTITYPTETTISLSESNSGDGDLTYIIYRDGVSIGTGETITLGYGTYDYVLNTTGGANYTANASMDAQTLTINQNAGACDVLFNETSPLTYPATFRVYSNCNSAFTLYRNGTEVANNSEQSLEAGTYNFTVQRTDTENYSNTYDEELFTIVQNIPTIYFVEQVSDVTLNGGTTKTVQVIFNVSYPNVKTETANVSFSKAGETTRYASSCNNDTFSNQFNCSVDMQFYDSAGLDWIVNATINSTEDDIMSNSSIQFTVNNLDYITQDTNIINWSSVYSHTDDNEADSPIILTNGGNQDYSNISIQAYNSTGDVSGQIISASSFSVDADTGQSSGQTYMSEGNYVQIVELTGLNDHGASVTENIYFYVDLSSLKSDIYIGDSGWVIKCSA